jgi:outer membrane protein, heavy metal efflux system
MFSRGFSASPLLCLCVLGCLSLSEASAGPLTLEQAVSLALERSPVLVSLEAGVARAQAQAQNDARFFQANPELSAAAGPRLRDGGNTLELGLGLSQQVEIFGQPSARKEAARALVTASEALVRARRVELVAEVRTAFARAQAAGQEVRLAEDARTLAAEALSAAEERLEAGAASRLEVNTARVEAGRAARESNRAVFRHASALNALGLLIGLDEAVEVQAQDPRLADNAPALSLPTLLAQALRDRADLQAARAELEASQAQQRLNQRAALPSPRAGVSYGREEEAHIVQGTLSIELPVFDRNQAGRGTSAARVTEAARTLEAVERRARTEVRLALVRYQAAESSLRLFGENAQQALQENLALATEGYRAGKMDFLELLVIRRETLEARRDHIEAMEEFTTAQAQLQQVIGSLP